MLVIYDMFAVFTYCSLQQRELNWLDSVMFTSVTSRTVHIYRKPEPLTTYRSMAVDICSSPIPEAEIRKTKTFRSRLICHKSITPKSIASNNGIVQSRQAMPRPYIEGSDTKQSVYVSKR